MSTTTTNLGLKKPATTDYYNIQDFNDNADALDTFAGNTITTDKLINNLAATEAGFGLDSRQGPVIGNRLTTVEGNLSTANTNLNNHLADLITDSDGAHGLKYEKGNWTPVLKVGTNTTNFTYSSQIGRYIKINNMVTVFFDIIITAKSTATGVLSIGELPFAVAEIVVSSALGDSQLIYPSNVSTIVIRATSLQIDLLGIGNNTETTLNDTNISASSYLRGQMNYITY